MATNNTTTDLTVKDISDNVLVRINELVDAKKLRLPEGYDAGTSLKFAMLKIQDLQDRNKMPALKVCTTASISKALLNMCIQGLQPEKNQCYFIVYGNELQLTRSYFGTVAALRRANPNVDKVVCDLAHEGDEAEYGYTEYGERYIVRITTDPITNINKPITYGFCNIYSKTGEILGFTIMTWADIQKSWEQSLTYNRDNSVHKKFPSEMAKRTLIARACKFLLNTTTESDSIVTQAFNDTTQAEFKDSDKVITPPTKKSVKERFNIPSKKDVVATVEPTKEEPVKEEPKPVEQAPTPEQEDEDALFQEAMEDEMYQQEMFADSEDTGV